MRFSYRVPSFTPLNRWSQQAPTSLSFRQHGHGPAVQPHPSAALSRERFAIPPATWKDYSRRSENHRSPHATSHPNPIRNRHVDYRHPHYRHHYNHSLDALRSGHLRAMLARAHEHPAITQSQRHPTGCLSSYADPFKSHLNFGNVYRKLKKIEQAPVDPSQKLWHRRQHGGAASRLAARLAARSASRSASSLQRHLHLLRYHPFYQHHTGLSWRRKLLSTPFFRRIAQAFMLSVYSLPDNVVKSAVEEFFEVFWASVLDFVC